MPGFRLESPMVQNAVAIKEPLAPHVMSQAGVPIEDALWFSRLPSPRAKVQALATPRGNGILSHVRKFMRQAANQQAAAVPV